MTRRFVFVGFHAVFKAFHRATQVGADVAQFFRAKHHQHNNQDD